MTQPKEVNGYDKDKQETKAHINDSDASDLSCHVESIIIEEEKLIDELNKNETLQDKLLFLDMPLVTKSSKNYKRRKIMK